MKNGRLYSALCNTLVLLAFVLWCSPSLAGGNVWVPVQNAGIDFTPGSHTRYVDLKFMERVPPGSDLQQTRFINRNVPISAASARAVAAQGLRYAGLAGAAVSIGIAAKDFFWSEADDDFMTYVGELDTSATATATAPVWGMFNAYGNCAASGWNTLRFSHPAEALGWWVSNVDILSCVSSSVVVGVRIQPAEIVQVTSNVRYRITIQRLNSSGSVVGSDNFDAITTTGTVNESFTGPILFDLDTPAPATDLQVNEGISNDVLSRLITEAILHGYSHVIPEIAAIAAQLSEMLDSADPAYDPVLDSQTGIGAPVVEIMPSSSTSTQTSVEVEFPVFCEWAGIVCTFIDWFTGESAPPEDVVMPFDDVLVPDDVSIGTSFTCPGAVTGNYVHDLNLSFDPEPLCDFGLSYARPVLLVVGALMSLMIILGVRT